MGEVVGDFNNDGLLDWYLSNTPPGFGSSEGNMLFLNLGAHNYVEVADEAQATNGHWGWGVVAVDFNHDGLLDIGETNGWPDFPNISLLFLNQGVTPDPARGVAMPNFTEVGDSIGFSFVGMGRGLVNFDYDNDGDQDMLLIPNDESPRLFRNDLSGDAANWLRVFLDTSSDPALPPNGFGAKVVVTTASHTLVRSIDGGCTFNSTAELSAHFGLGDDTLADVRVEWPNGEDSIFEDIPVNQTITVVNPAAADLNDDGIVGPPDLSILLAAWGTSGSPADLDDSGVVGAPDLSILLASWST